MHSSMYMFVRGLLVGWLAVWLVGCASSSLLGLVFHCPRILATAQAPNLFLLPGP